MKLTKKQAQAIADRDERLARAKAKQKTNVVDMIIAYESGELNDNETLELFSNLIKSGQAWRLQGHYGRTARAIIEAGYISEDGEILEVI